MAKKFYITTAIDYVNANPHVGHAFEKVIADALARYRKSKGDKVFFLTGVDEHAQKNVQAAEAAGVPVKEFIDKNAALFLDLCKKLNISYDKFIRTSAREHTKVVHEVLKKVTDKGDIYKGNYEGYYCTGCEAFITEKYLVDGKCPEHNKKPEFLKQEAYFFKLSKYRKRLIKFVENYIVPESRKKEILSRLKEDLKDVCISRKGAEWGIDFPGDKNFKVWVWIDALINYISGAKEKWPADVHVIGKGINWFHSVIWPALLFSAGYKRPNTLLVHGYLNFRGKKISKSLGNIIDPLELIKKYGTDPVRYALLRSSVFDDSDFSEEILIKRNNNELANKLGNLVSRVSGLIEKYGFDKKTRDQHLPERFRKALEKNNVEYEEIKRNIELYENKSDLDNVIRLIKIKKEEGLDGHLLNYPQLMNEVTQFFVKKYIESFQFDKALDIIFASIDCCNEFIQLRKPWEKSKSVSYRKWVLGEAVRAIREIAELLWPFIPESSEKITKHFNAKKIKKAEPLFRKV